MQKLNTKAGTEQEVCNPKTALNYLFSTYVDANLHHIISLKSTHPYNELNNVCKMLL